MKIIFVMGAYYDMNKGDLESYKIISDYLEEKYLNYKIINPFMIEQYRNSFNNLTYQKANEQMVLYDLDCVRQASLLVVDLTNKSTGVGMELGLAKEYNKNIVFLAKEGSSISDMVKGAFPNHNINYYTTKDDIINILEKEIIKYDL